MVMPVIAAAAGSGLLGSVISGLGSLFGSKKNKDAAAEAAMQNYLAQKEFAQNSIRWRVEDAKAAGLHPLYALGGGGASFSPSFVVGNEGAGIADAGQHLGRAVTAALQPSERALRDAQLLALQAAASKDIAQAALYDSERARISQEANSSKPIGIGSMEEVFPVYEHMSAPGGSVTVEALRPVIAGQVTGKPAEQLSAQKGNPNTLAGQHTMFQETVVGRDGATILMPHTGGQMSEEIDMVLLVPWVAANVQKYGAGEFLRRYFKAEKGSSAFSRSPLDAPLVESIAWGLEKARR